MKKILITLIPVLFVYSFTSSFNSNTNYINIADSITSEEIISHIKYLSSDELEGRFPGTKGDSLTDIYLINEFKSYNLSPGGEDGFKQYFDFISEVKLAEKNSLTISFKDSKEKFKVSEDFIPIGLSSNLKVSGDIVFCGYGIKAPDLNYNDYEKVDVKDKIVMILKGSPASNNPHDNPFFKYERLPFKLITAKEAGAKGVIFVVGPESNEEDQLIKLKGSNIESESGIAVINIKRSLAEKIFTAVGDTLSILQKKINDEKKPDSFILQDITAKFQVDLKRVRSNTANIIGFLEGSDPVLKNEVIVIGAHKDHLGDGLKYGSLYEKNEPAVHNGADDNASGTSGVLELAELLSSERENLKRSYLFMLFGAEESGTLGSIIFTKSKLYPKYNPVAMINLDMIGRASGDKLVIGGTGTSSKWIPILDSLSKISTLNITYKPEGYGPSDHSSFYAKDIPVLFFFTGLHTDYHKPSDDWHLIDPENEVKILNIVYGVIKSIDASETKPDHIKVKDEEKPQTNRGFKVTVGLIPDYTSNVEGLSVLGVKEGSPGEKAGLKAGDVIIKFGNRDIKNIYDYTYALGDYKPGDEVDAVVLRGEEKITLHIKLTGK